MFGPSWRPLVAALSPLAVVAVSIVNAPTASASTSYAIAWTEIGIYPRATPSMDAERVGDALSDGTYVSIECETTGQSVDNGFAPTDIWARLSDGTYLPSAFINTGVDGFTPGISRCDSTSPEVAGDESSGSSWVPYCGPSEFFSEILVERWANDDFKIVATINGSARIALDAHAATVAEWHAIQDCVSGLEGSLADSIWDQLSCHQHLALVPGKGGWASGPSYDLESWRGTFEEYEWIGVSCGNALNGEHTDEPVSFGRPDAGATDLSYGDIG